MLVRLFKRHPMWIAVAAMAAFILGLLAILPHPDGGIYLKPVCAANGPNGPVAEAMNLVTKFERTVFRSEMIRGHDWQLERVYKWKEEVHIETNRIPHDYQNLVKETAREFSCISGLWIYFHPKGTRLLPKIYIVLRPRADIDALARNEKIGIGEIKTFYCYTVPNLYLELPGVKQYAISVAEYLGEAERRHCMVKMLARTLGLFADSDVVRPSIFGPGGDNLDHLPINDMIILRTLYDPRIKRGMKRAAAMKVAAEIIPELVDAVHKRGVQALYQR